MARKYKLRFGDGTTLALDEEGLRTWISQGKVDEQTTVQPPGSKAWHPLREFLAQEGAGRAGRAPAPGDSGSIRLAAIDDEPEVTDEDLYDGEPGYSPVSIAWLWLKRLVLTFVLLAGLGTAAVYWDVWLPRVTEFGLVVFTAIDEKLHARSPAPPSAEQEHERQLRDALLAATEQLPHLEAETIQRVMSSSVVGVLDPPEVFSRSHEAIQRGLPSLSKEEAQEAREIKAALIAALRPVERERLREYDRMRAHRATLPFEDREALALTARGARALPAAHRQRLQMLWAKAAAAGQR